MENWLALSFFGYFGILLAIGLLLGKKQSSTEDFIVGNRRLNYWLTALNAHASDMSAWVFMAFPAAFFMSGMPNLWIAIGLVIGMFLNWHFVAKRLRIQTEQYNCCTLSTYFERRFQDKSHTLRLATAAISVFFLAVYASAGFIAMGDLLENIFGLDYYLGLCIATAVVVSYVYFGGFEAIARTDFFQGIFLLLVILAVPIIAYFKLEGGWQDIQVAAQQKSISLSIIPDFSLASFFLILSLATWGPGYFGQPHIITKFMGIRDPNELVKAKYLGITWQILILFGGALIGLIGIAFFKQPIANPELIFIEMSKALFVPQLLGVVFCAIIAANVSTLASQILVCASAFSEDLYKRSAKEEVCHKRLLKISQWSSIGVATVALGIALMKSTTIMAVVQYAWNGLGCSFGPLVLMSLYSKTANRYGAIAGVCVGGFLSATWPLINPHLTQYAIPSMIPAFLFSLLAIHFVSRFLPLPIAEQTSPNG